MSAWRRLWSLIKINLLYRQPEITQRERKKHKSGNELVKTFILLDLASCLLLIFVFGLLLFSNDFIKNPGIFTASIMWFGVIALSQEIIFIYNIFFDSRDLDSYLPLPFKTSEIFLAKMFTVFWSILPYTLPMYLMMLITAWQAKIFFGLAALGATISYVLLLVLLNELGSLLVFSLTKSEFFRQHKKLITFLLLGISTGTFIFSYLFFMNTFDTVTKINEILFLMPFYRLIVMPSWQVFWLSLLEILAVLGILGLILRRFTLADLNKQMVANKSQTVIKKHRAYRDLRQILGLYNRRLLNDPNLLLQVLLNSLVMPIMFLIPNLVNRSFNLQNVEPRYYSVFLLSGVLLAVLTYNAYSLGANIISLDRENLIFVQSLPIGLKQYLQSKFRLVLKIQLAFSTLFAFGIGIVVRVPLLGTIYLLVGILSATYICTLYFFARDWRKRYLKWTTITQLFTRDGGQFMVVFQLLATLFIGAFCIGIAILLASLIPPILTNTVVPLIIFGITFLCHKYYQRTFWQKLA